MKQFGQEMAELWPKTSKFGAKKWVTLPLTEFRHKVKLFFTLSGSSRAARKGEEQFDFVSEIELMRNCDIDDDHHHQCRNFSSTQSPLDVIVSRSLELSFL
eukprot:sb/3478531/